MKHLKLVQYLENNLEIVNTIEDLKHLTITSVVEMSTPFVAIQFLRQDLAHYSAQVHMGTCKMLDDIERNIMCDIRGKRSSTRKMVRH